MLDSESLNRLKWRCRRGLLENDLLIERFFERHAGQITPTQAEALHALMALADNLGGTATTANLKPGQSTTTIESKTNFFAAVPIGDVATAECTPLHRGRTTMVWQTRVTRSDGRLCALVTQTQLVLERGRQ